MAAGKGIGMAIVQHRTQQTRRFVNVNTIVALQLPQPRFISDVWSFSSAQTELFLRQAFQPIGVSRLLSGAYS